MKRRALLGIALVTAASLTLAGCGATKSASSTGTISAVFSNIAAPTSLDPAIGYDSNSLEFIRNVYDGLTQYSVGGSEVQPNIASSWTTNDDATEYTFTLRDGVKFHDGTALTSADVVESVERVKGINQGPASLLGNIKTVAADGDHKVVFDLTSPDVYLPGKLQKVSIVEKSAVVKHSTSTDQWAKAWFADHEAGSGPYKLKEYDKTGTVEMTAFKGYWRKWDAQAPTEVTLRTDADVSTALQLMRQGKIDMMGAVGPDDSASAKSIPGVKLVEQPNLQVQELPMNVKSKTLSDVRVRKAISLAFDYDALKTYYKGYSQTPTGPLPTGFGGGIESLPVPAQNLTEAKALLKQAGYGNGLTITYLGLSGLSYEEFTGTLLQSTLKKIGITVKLQMVPWAQMVSIQSKPDTAADISFLNMSATTNDPSTILSSIYSSSQIASKGGYNWSYFEDPTVDSEIASLSTIKDETTRNAAVVKVVQDIKDKYLSVYASQPTIAQPVLKDWDVKYEVMDNTYMVRFFYAKKTS